MEKIETLINLDLPELQELITHLDGGKITSPKVKSLVNKLTEEDRTKLKTPIATKSVLTDHPVLGGRIQMGPLYIPFKPFWLHA